MSAAIVEVNTIAPQAKLLYLGLSALPRRIPPRFENAINRPARKKNRPIRI